jgi:hypothetical protein
VIARRRSPEAAIQRAVIEHLRLRAKPDVLWLHVPNGGSRDIREAANLKRMGALAGASDLLLFRPGACPHCNSARLEGFALELKAPGGRPSEPQLDFMARFNDAGGHTCIAEGLNQALAALESWQLLRGGVS